MTAVYSRCLTQVGHVLPTFDGNAECLFVVTTAHMLLVARSVSMRPSNAVFTGVNHADGLHASSTRVQPRGLPVCLLHCGFTDETLWIAL